MDLTLCYLSSHISASADSKQNSSCRNFMKTVGNFNFLPSRELLSAPLIRPGLIYVDSFHEVDYTVQSRIISNYTKKNIYNSLYNNMERNTAIKRKFDHKKCIKEYIQKSF